MDCSVACRDGILEPTEDGKSVSPERNGSEISANSEVISSEREEGSVTTKRITVCDVRIVQPHSLLPRPEAPPGLYSSPERPSSDESADVDVSAVIGKFFRERSNSFSAAIVRRLSSFKDSHDEDGSRKNDCKDVTEYNLSGLTVIVKLKAPEKEVTEIKGRISFFSRSNCRDCTAVRKFLREKRLRFVEINIDVFPNREKELVERTGSSSVPMIFFNEKLFGGLVAINSLRNSGGFDRRVTEMLAAKCPDDAPSPPVYGFDDGDEHGEEEEEEMIAIVRVLRQKMPIQDRLIKMKFVKNCFSGAEMVEALVHHLDCGRRKAVEIGKQIAQNHFIHHIFGENDFGDGNHFYRFLEHEPFIPKCFNFRGGTNDGRPKSAIKLGEKLNKIMSAILETYTSDDRRRVDYIGISNSEEFRRYVNLTHELHRINLAELSPEQRLAFFLNLYNAMVIHAVIRLGQPEGVMDRRFFSDFQYLVGGHAYSLSTIKNGILRNNRRPPYFLVKPFGSGDSRLELALAKANPLIHFGLCDGTRSSPIVRFFSPQGVETELRSATREFFQSVGMDVDLEKRTAHLTQIVKWFDADFGQGKEILKWVLNYLDATKAGLLTHLLDDGGHVGITYKNYDWSMNS